MPVARSINHRRCGVVFGVRFNRRFALLVKFLAEAKNGRLKLYTLEWPAKRPPGNNARGVS